MIDANKFVWAYMIENGIITNKEWSFYGSGWTDVDGYDCKKIVARKEKLKNSIKSVGINWEKTSIPESASNSIFTDTFHPAERVESLLGTLVLNDNSSYYIGVSNAEQRFTSYVQSLNELANDRQRVKDILGE